MLDDKRHAFVAAVGWRLRGGMGGKLWFHRLAGQFSELLTIVGDSCKVTVPLDQRQRYFRLRKRDLGGAGTPDPIVTNGYITAVLHSECTSAPQPPPGVGKIAVGSNYVVMTVAYGDPLDYQSAPQIVTDAVFESLMPLYCGLPDERCVTNRV